MSHRPAGCFATFEDYLSEEINPEYDQFDTTCREREIGLGDVDDECD